MSCVAARLDDLPKALWPKPLWIAGTVLGFALYWPVGLALLFFGLWSRNMGCGHRGRRARWQGRDWQERADRWFGHGGERSSGNRAFDAYREETLRRLEDEQREFHDFLDRLRFAKDKAQFDEFLAERRNRPQQPGPEPQSP